MTSYKENLKTEYGARSYSIGRRKGKLHAYSHILELIKNWDVEACCHGLRQNELIIKIKELMKEEDMRWKVNEEQIRNMVKDRKEGRTLQWISDNYGISTSQVSYWTNEGYRNKQRAKNALRRFGR